ncbi:hypothetical protein BJG93_35235 [Paraburkholderia sprentiae WSM5005]|uniref:Uncharacterized protein n=1 Tax=Paraburkholderia sprentiae WSM5005 TaxID=754502 RepID=A0A8F4KIB2_9BURK|nr:hypothetical protein BJG93_35235 [Paraburkholderia sprentiae WSM5005]
MAARHGIGDSMLRRWVDAYRLYGDATLCPRRSRYDVHFAGRRCSGSRRVRGFPCAKSRLCRTSTILPGSRNGCDYMMRALQML